MLLGDWFVFLEDGRRSEWRMATGGRKCRKCQEVDERVWGDGKKPFQCSLLKEESMRKTTQNFIGNHIGRNQREIGVWGAEKTKEDCCNGDGI
jgi:hypothetical protein